MRKFALLLLLIPTALSAQSIQTISPQQCVWRAGDNPAWAAPNLDESAWQPYAQWRLTSGQPRIWVRCHADLSALRDAAHPALQVSVGGDPELAKQSAYQLYFNGKLEGQSGNLRNGHYTMYAIGTYPIPIASPAPRGNIIAVRMVFRAFGFLGAPAPTIRAGEEAWLLDRRDSQMLGAAVSELPQNIGFAMIGVIGFVLAGLYLNERSRLELLLLALLCEGLWIESLIHSSFPLPDRAFWILDLVGSLLLQIPLVWFPFRIAHRRMPLAFKLLLGIALTWSVWQCLSNAFSPVRASLSVSAFLQRWEAFVLAVRFVLAAAPFMAFWPWNRVPERMRAVAACTTLLAPIWLVWWSGELWAAISPAGLALFSRWETAILDLRVFITMAVIVALMALLFRDQRRTASERAVLAGEMLAAQEIQRMLVPQKASTAPAIRLGIAFQPMREVGGDFYQCSVLPDGTQRILVGDVSGKGAAAAMTATLLIGASKGRPSDSPSELLQHLNHALGESDLAGFVTCLCAHIAPDGVLKLANAGHLAPYRNGEEMPVESGLPLGILPEASYSETTIQLAPNDRLTLLTDGVVEAQSPTGELFGFDRTAAISTQTAEEIAQAAQQFGQEDDITVLTLQFAPAEVLRA
jgi:Stage II sporulation protein E (SpoIIE)